MTQTPTIESHPLQECYRECMTGDKEPQMRRPILNATALAAAASLAACGANPVPEAPEPTDSIVFGHAVMVS